MNLGLKGKVALVAASSKGLGRAVADEMGAEGASLVMCARDAGHLDEAKLAISERCGVDVVAVPADLSDPEQLDRVVADGLGHFGKIDILVTNTGGPPAGPFEDHSREVWHDAVRQNLDSVVNLTRAVLPGMKERRWGRILNITSIAVKQPVDGLMLSNIEQHPRGGDGVRPDVGQRSGRVRDHGEQRDARLHEHGAVGGTGASHRGDEGRHGGRGEGGVGKRGAHGQAGGATGARRAGDVLGLRAGRVHHGDINTRRWRMDSRIGLA